MLRPSALAAFVITIVLAAESFAQSSKAKNIIIFMGDGVGVSSLKRRTSTMRCR
jgi:alkaline phosphatase